VSAQDKTYDIVVLGAGVSGLYQLKRALELEAEVIALEADEDLGGTWYRNRYPGARFDSESYTYGYSFSRELLEEWRWHERFSP
jgi:cation diffusion facilitator CzcD-associated flavoprotein CzcO